MRWADFCIYIVTTLFLLEGVQVSSPEFAQNLASDLLQVQLKMQLVSRGRQAETSTHRHRKKQVHL